MVGVEDDRDAVGEGGTVDVFGGGDPAFDGTFLVFFCDGATDEEVCSAVGELDDDWGGNFSGSGECGID